MTTFIELGGLLDVADLVAVGDYIVTGDPFRDVLPLAPPDELIAAVTSESRARGRRALIEALGLIRVGPLSRPESLLRLLLVAAGIPEPKLNWHVANASGSFVAMVDLAWPEYRLALEYEGRHHAQARQFGKDLGRIERIVDTEWGVVRTFAEELFDRPGAVVTRIAARLRARGWVGAVELPERAVFTR